MKSEKAAEGILKRKDWGDAKLYQVACDCGQSNHNHDIWIEADDTGISVNIYATIESPWWKWNRFKQIWQLLTKGYLKYETTITFNKQVALNYAETLKLAIKDVEQFRKEHNVKN